MRTVIGFGSPKAGTSKVHGEALGGEAVKATKKNLGWPEDKTFYVPEEAQANWDTIKARGKKAHKAWTADFEEYKKAYPAPASRFERHLSQAGQGLGEENPCIPDRETHCHP